LGTEPTCKRCVDGYTLTSPNFISCGDECPDPTEQCRSAGVKGVDEVCRYSFSPEGTECSDGDKATVNDQCDTAGECVGEGVPEDSIRLEVVVTYNPTLTADAFKQQLADSAGINPAEVAVLGIATSGGQTRIIIDVKGTNALATQQKVQTAFVQTTVLGSGTSQAPAEEADITIFIIIGVAGVAVIALLVVLYIKRDSLDCDFDCDCDCCAPRSSKKSGAFMVGGRSLQMDEMEVASLPGLDTGAFTGGDDEEGGHDLSNVSGVYQTETGMARQSMSLNGADPFADDGRRMSVNTFNPDGTRNNGFDGGTNDDAPPMLIF